MKRELTFADGSEKTEKAVKPIVNWDYPTPRLGLWGWLDRFIGPGATRAEIILQFGIAALGAIIAPIYAHHVVNNWTLFQYLISSVLAFDIVGGLITNATSSAKRWHHRQGQGFEQHFAMVSRHLFHLLLVSCLYLAFDTGWFIVASGYLLLAAIVILIVPAYLQRPVALIAYSSVLLLSAALLVEPKGLEWFLPLFYLKVLVSHLLKEEPYQPDATNK